MRRYLNPTAPAKNSGMPFAMALTQESTPYEMVKRSIEVNEYDVYFSESFDEPLAYVELLSALRRAEQHDTFNFYLNTPGGRLDTGLQIINAIRDSAARVVTILDPQAYSMGALLFLAGDQLVVPENAMLMFHNYSSGLVGKGNEQLAEVQAASRSFEKVMKQICVPFLSADEVKNILNGQDLWLASDDIRKRLQRMQVNATTERPTARNRRNAALPTEAAPEGAPASKA